MRKFTYPVKLTHVYSEKRCFINEHSWQQKSSLFIKMTILHVLQFKITQFLIRNKNRYKGLSFLSPF